MPKASAEATLKVKIQARALVETGKYTQEEICEAIKKNGGSLSRKTLIKWINENPSDIWQSGTKTENPEQKKQEQKQALQPFIKETVTKTIELQKQKKQELQPQEKTQFELQKEKAKDNAKQIDELTKAITEQFFEEEKIKEFVLSTGLLGMHRIRQVLLTNKQYYDGEEQQVGLQSSVHYLRLAQAFDNIAGTLGFSSKRDGLTVAIQNNNQNSSQVAKTQISDVINGAFATVTKIKNNA